ncbi:MAG: hypothetical protein JOZ40_03615 [Methylobacteriaceae bacterium]|nr:hypothetical protein [Methylobacteriaceae bacterium]
MDQTPPPVFGKRRPVQADIPARSLPPAEAPLSMAALSFVEAEREAGVEASGTATVPNSIRACILAGLVVSFASAALGIEQSAALSEQVGSISVNGQPIPTMVLIILGSLWTGARASAFSVYIVHTMLQPIGRTGFLDYALGGACAAGLFAGAVQFLGFGAPPHGWTFDIGAGFAAGAFYRLFAGTRWERGLPPSRLPGAGPP